MKKKKAMVRQIDWANAPLIDGKNPITLEITTEEIVFGKANPNACPVALAGKKQHEYFAVGVDVVHVGEMHNGQPYRVRYRAGNFPRRYDRALQQMITDTSMSFADCNIKPITYTLTPPKGTQTLAGKLKENSRRRKLGLDKVASSRTRNYTRQPLNPYQRGRLV